MQARLAPFAPYVYAILRIVVGLLFLCHGAQKLFGWFGGQPVAHPSLLGLAGILEVVLGFLVGIGFLTSYAAFIASGEMAVAYFKSHHPRAFWPIENQGEVAVLFCFIFLWIATRGGGAWSVDAARGRAETEDPARDRRAHA
jgi:putative oxidoreductase